MIMTPMQLCPIVVKAGKIFRQIIQSKLEIMLIGASGAIAQGEVLPHAAQGVQLKFERCSGTYSEVPRSLAMDPHVRTQQ